MRISVYNAMIIGLLLIINNDVSIGQQLECIPAQYCGLVWSKRLRCCDETNELPKCGRERKFPVNAKIYGDEEAAIGEFPWIGQIFYQSLKVSSECIGSLITRRFVLSAAHCVAKKNMQLVGKPIFVRLGEHNTSSRIDCVRLSSRKTKCADKPIDIKIISFVSHPKFMETSRNGHYDIAIIKLEKLAKLSDFINTICLPDEVALNFENDRLKFIVSGWGETRKGIKSLVKLKATLPNYDFAKCSEFYYNKTKINLNEGQICAGGKEGYDSCRGDSGGPLMYYDVRTDRFLIVGVVSFGAKRCGSKNFPGVYANVQTYLEWIANNTKDYSSK